MGTRAIGIDIGTRAVTVAEVRQVRGRTIVTNFGGIDLPPDAVRDGEVVDGVAVAEALRDLIETAELKRGKVWLGVANQRVVVRQVQLPWMDPDELRTSLRYQVQEYIPIPVDEAELDLHVLEEVTGDDGARFLKVLLVAAHRDMVTHTVDVVTQAGLKPVGVDLNAFATLRVLGATDPVSTGAQVLVDVGAGVTNVVVHEHGVPGFVRLLALGGDDLTAALADRLELSVEDAERLKRRCVVDDLAVSGSVTAQPAATSTLEQANRIVTEEAERIIEEIRTSLDYYQAQTAGLRVSGVVLTGGGALLPGLIDRAATVLRLPVELGNPFDRLPVSATVYGPTELARLGPGLTTAIGLALGGLR